MFLIQSEIIGKPPVISDEILWGQVFQTKIKSYRIKELPNLLCVSSHKWFLNLYFGDVSCPNKCNRYNISREMMIVATTTLSVHYIFSVLFTGISGIIIFIVYVGKLSLREVKWLPKVRGSSGIQSKFFLFFFFLSSLLGWGEG